MKKEMLLNILTQSSMCHQWGTPSDLLNAATPGRRQGDQISVPPAPTPLRNILPAFWLLWRWHAVPRH